MDFHALEYTYYMGIFSFFFGGTKRDDTEHMQRAARGQSVVGNFLGSSPYMQEWRKQNKNIREQYRLQEKSLRKQWKREDEHIEYEMAKVRRKYGETTEQKQRADIARSRAKMIENMEREENEQIRSIASTIKQYR